MAHGTQGAGQVVRLPGPLTGPGEWMSTAAQPQALPPHPGTASFYGMFQNTTSKCDCCKLGLFPLIPL